MASKAHKSDTMPSTEGIHSQSTVTVPEVVESMRYEGIGRRAVAIIVDSIVLLAVYIAMGYTIALLAGGATATGFSLQGVPALLLMGSTLIIGFGYFIVLEGRNGQTLGKRLVGIRVVKENGNPCDFSASAVRNVLRIVDGIFFYLVGAAFVGLSERKQRLGDRLADTVVVRT